MGEAEAPKGGVGSSGIGPLALKPTLPRYFGRPQKKPPVRYPCMRRSLLFLLLLLPFLLAAQTATVSGVVRDDENRPLPDASIASQRS